MKRKGIFTILAALFMVLAFSAMALAANNVRLTTTVPNIPKSTCYQAGTDTLEFDHLTAIAEGDVIQITLNNKVTVCKTIDMWVQVNAANVAVLNTSANAPVATTGGTVNATGAATKEWGFLVKAAAGSQIINVTFRVRDNVAGLLDGIGLARVMTFTGTTAADKLIVKLFDSKIGFGTSFIFKQAPVPVVDTYFTAVVAADNILCIDTMTLDFPDEYVQNTPDSLPVNVVNKMFFSGDYRIAHIMAQQLYSIVPCAKSTVGHIKLGADGQPPTCQSFDFEVAGAGVTNVPPPYCSDHAAGNRMIIATSSTFDPVAYAVTMRIVVERLGAVKAIPGVYWSTTAPGSLGAVGLTAACAAVPVAWAGTTYRQVNAIAAATPRAVAAANCNLTALQKAVYLDQAAAVLTAIGNNHLYINLPDFNYDPAEVLAGDVVKVRVTLTKVGCGAIGPLDITVGTFGCGAVPIVGSAQLCPYVTSLATGDSFWNGIAITNSNAADGNVLLTATKNDGSVSTYTAAIPANGMFVSFVSDIPWTGTQPIGVPAYINATSADIPAGSLNVFIMMADGTNNSMGYLCKP